MAFSLSHLRRDPILMSSPLTVHLYTSHTVRGSMPGVALRSKNSFRKAVMSGSSSGSVNSDEFSLQELGLGGGPCMLSDNEVGAWSDIDNQVKVSLGCKDVVNSGMAVVGNGMCNLCLQDE